MTTVYCTEGGARLDVFLADETELSRSHIKKLIDDGKIFIGGVRAFKAGVIVKTGDEVTFEDETENAEIVPEDIALDVVYEDDDVAVINKQRHLIVHPGAGNRNGTLVNALMFRYGAGLSFAYGATRAGIVHRLDKDTTGLMVIAKNDFAHRKLGEQFAAHTVSKFYRAIADGNMPNNSGVISAPIARDPKNRLKMAVVAGGRSATTKYTVLERFEKHCYVEFELLSGRTHQIRVHSKYIGHPISCDALYGGKGLGVDGQLLHSYRLAFDHPCGERMEFIAELPNDFARVYAALKAKEIR